MVKFSAILELEDDFQPGNCYMCPLLIETVDGYDCILKSDWCDCPLKRVKER